MAQYIDCYWLINSREKKVIEEYLNEFLPKRNQAFDEQFLTLNNGKDLVFTSSIKLMDYMEKKPNLDCSIYWNNLDQSSIFCHAMVFYTQDNKMIFGMSVLGRYPNESKVVKSYFEINDFLKAEYGCMTSEEPPEYGEEGEFIDFCKSRFTPTR